MIKDDSLHSLYFLDTEKFFTNFWIDLIRFRSYFRILLRFHFVLTTTTTGISFVYDVTHFRRVKYLNP